MRTIAVDWSGAATGAPKYLWLADVRDGELVRLESGRTRSESTDHLLELTNEDSDVVVGLDFAFSFPAWFLDRHGLETGRDAWRHAAAHAEDWLEGCDPPFWGRPGATKPELPAHFRLTERVVPDVTGISPKSVFQIGGAGAVGTGSLRGMPHLLELADAGYAVWPFEGASLPQVIEIDPRLLTGPVVKSSPEAREAYLERTFPGLSEEMGRRASEAEDAFDAAVSALIMAEHRERLVDLPQLDVPHLKREGLIWWPEWETADWEETISAPPDQIDLELSASFTADLGWNFDRALSFAVELHGDQVRKGGEEVPYLGHLLGVCSLVLEAGGDEEQAIAALLHDAAEDQGGRETLELIRQRFGDRVAEIVDACTDTFEDPKPPWRQRKTAYLDEVRSKPIDALLVVCADKLYNVRSILRDHRRVGDEVFDRFTGKKDGTLWYYRSLAQALSLSGLDSWLVDELARTVAELERAAGEGRSGDRGSGT